MSRATIVLGAVALAAVTTAVVVAIVNHPPSTKKHDVVASYIKSVDAIEQGMKAPLTKTIQAYRAFASKGSVGTHASDLAGAEATLATLHRRIASFPAPLPARRLRALLLEFVAGEIAVAREVGQLAVFSPRYAAVLRQSRAAGVELTHGLASVKSPKAKKIRGTKKQVAKAQAAFTAAANDAARKQADAVDAYGVAVAVLQARLRRLDPPAVMRPGYMAELRMLEASRRAGAALSRELRKANRAKVVVLGRRFTIAARTAGSVSAQRAQVAAIKAYNTRVRALNTLQGGVQKELARLQQLTG